MTTLLSMSLEEGIALSKRVAPKYAPAWRSKSPREQAAMAMYFLPHGSRKPTLCPTRPRVVKWYCPFADQSRFPSGHRYCINVYTGCSHGCVYCYAAGYQQEQVREKRDFAKLLRMDLADLEEFDVPPAPIHLSNSTDPFQPLEATAGYTRLALREILRHRHRFTSVVILTKNPRLAFESECVDLFHQLHAPSAECFVEVSLAFWRDEVRMMFEPNAPSIADRMEGIRRLRQADVPVVLRIDPLFPRSLLSDGSSNGAYQDANLLQPQTLDDLERLVGFGCDVGAKHIVYSPARIVQPRSRPLSEVMRKMRKVYESMAAPEKLTFRGGSWRLPSANQTEVTEPLRNFCSRLNIPAKCCKQNLLETR
ncbi:MAG: radical SAM protein [Phycisphaerae bacterium]|nr:radical SAM protein [Phycisphaerae bacterium]